MKFKRKILLLSNWLFLICISGRAQNLIPNPSFEDTVHCPTTIGQLNYSQSWSNPTQGTPDYFNVCSTTNAFVAHVPNNGFGNQVTHSGVAYGGFYSFYKGNVDAREYIQTNLSSVLNSGHKYLVSFYLSLSDGSQYALSCIGAFFSATPISQTGMGVFNHTPQVLNAPSNILSDRINWMLVSDTLYSNGSEQYITIGNFKHDSQVDTTYLGNIGGGNDAYYFIDDVSVVDFGPMNVRDYNREVKVSIFPNPAKEVLNIECESKDWELKIFDVFGNENYAGKYNNKQLLDISGLSVGIYFIQIQTNEKVYKSKFIKE